jgi:CubicO group peptidase (beta-lactamase class C family)
MAAENSRKAAALAIVSGDTVVFTKGFGVADIETDAPVERDMLFQIGSTTKMFVAVAVLKLSHQGRLALDAPIGSYLQGLSPRLSQVTAHQLLTHTAGLIDKSEGLGSDDETLLASGVHSVVNNDSFFTEPGEAFSYSSLGYDLLALLIQQVAGKPFADAMQQEVFAPLGMNSTTFRLTTAATLPSCSWQRRSRQGVATDRG